ncbi:MAG TPA: biotin carboxylase N-terminal domain-containing protein, partial [Polyangiaceae bacterium]
MFEKVLIANRGEIACRVIRTLRKLGVSSVAVYSEADRNSLHVLEADESVCVGPAAAAQSYLNREAILAAALSTGAKAIFPGYGFLSENAAFAEAVEAAGIAFVGPTPEQMRRFGVKHTARELAQGLGVPLLSGTPLLADVEAAVAAAEGVGYPVMLKSTAGGGGIGMQVCRDAAKIREIFESVRSLAQKNFGEGGVFLERFVERARHIEVQLFGDGQGSV